MIARGALIAAVSMLAARDTAEREITIRFRAAIADRAVDCASESGVTLADLRFFVHDVALLDQAGGATPLKLAPVAPWQSDRVALVDLETGADACRDGTRGVNAAIAGRASNDSYVGLAFTVGVPFDLNHADPIAAKAPLDDTAMHWHWMGGYKFLRAAIKTAPGTSWIHLGSTGCRGTIGRIDACDAPNRVRVELRRFDTTRDVVVVDVSELLPPSSAAEPTSHCMADAASEACTVALRNLGLADPSQPQQVFHAGS